ncbi:MAG: DedA family protein [bacterium]|nr:DedA family protein [bacterium]
MEMFVTSFYSLNTYILAFLDANTQVATFLLLLIEEAGIPIPIPGDIIIMYGGFRILQNNLTISSTFILLLIAVLVGSSILYWVSYIWGEKVALAIGTHFHLTPVRLRSMEKTFHKYGVISIIVGRHIPGFRILVTVFAGTARLPYPIFISSTCISSAVWIAFYLFLGNKVGAQTMALIANHQIISFLIPVVIIALILVTLLKGRRSKKL